MADAPNRSRVFRRASGDDYYAEQVYPRCRMGDQRPLMEEISQNADVTAFPSTLPGGERQLIRVDSTGGHALGYRSYEQVVEDLEQEMGRDDLNILIV